MEVVLSPGRFGDEKPGVPFQREEIREWSNIDRLTGMLERARVETGRWQTTNQGAAKSYGKVVDSRERNSADGSVIQRARRQVEIFQSQGRGRSVQVVRASQWSSSRVTESSSSNSQILPVHRKTEENGKEGFDDEKLLNSPRYETSENRGLREDAISERLSALIGTFKYSVSSTVPLRRIDSKYSSRAAIFANTRRRNSSEDVAGVSRERILHCEKNSSTRMESSSTMSNDKSAIEFNCVNSDREKEDVERNEDNWRDEISLRVDNDEKSRTKKLAIKLPPSSRSNRTVVNLMKDARTKEETKIHARNWPISPITIGNSTDREIDENNKKINEETASVNVTLCQKIPKRVGFCKTEIHFAADSGKINIVETDGKPPPTNKFRRRRRSSIVNDDKILPIGETINRETTKTNDDRAVDVASNRLNNDDVTTKNDHQRCHHTTTVKLGNETEKIDERGPQEASSQGILLRLENRIYDRLESYTSDIKVDSSVEKISNIETSMRTDIQALKSARLVLNLTRNPDRRTSVTNDREIYHIRDEDDELIDIVDDRTKKESENSTRVYHDWKNENEKKIIVLPRDDDDEKTILDDRKIHVSEFVEISASNETENIHDNKETITIAKLNNERHEESEIEKFWKKDDHDVLCKDAENNRVVLKVVTTHEPIVARVENDHIAKLMKKSMIGKKSSKASLPIGKKSQTEHTYANVFTGSNDAPIYENYKITTGANHRKIHRACEPIEKSKKSSRVVEVKIDDSSSKTPKEFECSNSTTKKSNIDEKSAEKSQNSSVVLSKLDKNVRDGKSLVLKKKSSVDSSSLGGRGSVENSGMRKISKNSTIKPNVKSATFVLSSERNSKVSNGIGNNRDEKNDSSKTSPTGTTSSRSTKCNKETRRKPMEVVYQTAVYNMRNEKLSKPQKGKETKGPRYLNELICGAKTKRPGFSRSKSSSTVQHSAHGKAASPLVRHWK